MGGFRADPENTEARMMGYGLPGGGLSRKTPIPSTPTTSSDWKGEHWGSTRSVNIPPSGIEKHTQGPSAFPSAPIKRQQRPVAFAPLPSPTKRPTHYGRRGGEVGGILKPPFPTGVSGRGLKPLRMQKSKMKLLI